MAGAFGNRRLEVLSFATERRNAGSLDLEESMKRHRSVLSPNRIPLRSIIISGVFLFLLADPVTAQVTDPLGDQDSQADIVGVGAEVRQDGEGARIQIEYAQAPMPPLVGYIFIDLDRNPATSVPSVSPLPGIDALVKYQLTFSGGETKVQVDIITQMGTDTHLPPKSTKVRFRIEQNTIGLTLSKDLLFDERPIPMNCRIPVPDPKEGPDQKEAKGMFLSF